MSQHDFSIANQTFPNTRVDINSAYQSLASMSGGASAPSTTYAGQPWHDTTNNLFKIRNVANSAWITCAYFDTSNDRWEIRSNIIQAASTAGLTFKNSVGTTILAVSNTGVLSGPLVDASETGKGIIEIGTMLEFCSQSADVAMTPERLHDAYSPLSLTYTSTINVDCELRRNFKVTLTGNTTFNLQNLPVGETIRISVTQDGTGSRTAAYQVTGGAGTILSSAPTLTTTASARDILYIDVPDTEEALVKAELDV